MNQSTNQQINQQVVMSCRVSQTWQQKIEKIATDRNKSSAEIMTEAIALYLGEVGANSSDRLLALEGDVAVLKQMLSQFQTTLMLLQQQLNPNLTPNLTLPSSVSQPFFENAIAEEEDWEDEPDEILYDFLEPN
jgi:predicted DNA-binding protein